MLLFSRGNAKIKGPLVFPRELDPMESEVLAAIEEETVDAARLVSSLVCDKGLDREEVFAALTSLIRQRLVLLMNG
jgi:hypothetical protein